MSNVRYPRLLDANLNEVRRLHPIDGSLSLNITPLSTATLTVLPEDIVPVRSWIEMYDLNGSVGIFRTKAPRSGYGEADTQIELEHAITEVGDSLCNGEVSESMPFNSALSRIWSFYKGSRWRLGTISQTDGVTLNLNYDNVLEAILGLLEQTPDYMLTFDFSTNPWTVNVASRGQTVSAEGRLERNIQSAVVEYDETDLCTVAYVPYETQIEGSDNEQIARYTADAESIQLYGQVEKSIPGNGYTQQQAERAAQLYLRKHKKPKIGIDIGGLDLSKITGETLDSFEVGKLFRLAIPKYGIVVEECITSLSYSSLYLKPESVRIMLADAQDKVIETLKSISSAISNAKKTTSGAKKKLYTLIADNDHLMYDVYDPNGILHNSIEATASYTRMQIENLANGMYSRIEQTASYIRTEVSDTANGLRSRIEQTASHLRSEFEDTANGLYSRIEQTASYLRAEYNDTAASLRSQIELTASHLRTDFEDTANGLRSSIEQTASRVSVVVDGNGVLKPASIVASINNATKESSVLISADRVSLSGNTTVEDSMTIENGALLVKKAAVFGTTSGKQVSINNGSVNASTLQVNSGGKLVIVGSATGEHYDITSSVVQGIIKSASVDGNVLTLTPFYGNPITFSKATSLSGGWSGGNYVVTAKQNGTTVNTHTYNPPMRLNGVTSASNFSAEIYETPSGGTPVARKSIYGYLVSGGTGSGSYVDVNTKNDGTGTSVARLSVGTVYTAGKADGETAGKNAVTIKKGSWSSGQVQFTKSAGTASTKGVRVGLDGSWSGTSYNYTIKDYYDNQQGVSTGYTGSIDGSGLYANGKTDGQNAVTIKKGSWSSGQIQFTKSAGTASTKGVRVGLDGSWNGTSYDYTIKDYYDNQQGVSTGYTGSIDASGFYNVSYTEITGGNPSSDSGSISGYYPVGAISRPSSHSYVKFSVTCRGTTRLMYITVN